MKNSRVRLTAVILAKDEEKVLPRCLKSLKFVDEIVLVDDGSVDKTVEIAEKFDARIYQRRLDDFSSQRNFALSKVKTKWVLMIDPDEEVPGELAREINNAIRQDRSAGFEFPRKNLMFDHWIQHAGWWPDYQCHLFQTKLGHYDELVHEQVKIEGKVSRLKNSLTHYNYESISHFMSDRKFNLYTDLEAQQLYKSDYEFFWFDLIGKPIDEFLRRFFAEKGYRDGLVGLILCLLQSFKELVIYAKVWELGGRKNNLAGQEMVKELGERIVGKVKEFGYWFSSALIDLTDNKVKKTLLKIKRKLADE